MSFADFFENTVGNFKPGANGQATGKCPLHEDHNPSFSVNVDDGLWKCHGCGEAGNARQLADRLGVALPEFLRPHESMPITEIARYTYNDEHGKPYMQVRKYCPKTFKQLRSDGKGGWIFGLNGLTPILYHLPEILKAPGVYIAEGEKDVETLRSWGIPSTTNPGGALKWRDEFSEVLRGKPVVICRDMDPKGLEHAQQVARSLWGKAKTIKIVEVPKGKDISEWKELGGKREDLLGLIQNTSVLKEVLELPKKSKENFVPEKPAWPSLSEEAFYGLAGKIVRTIEPYSEADAAALLVNILVGFGNVIGHKHHFLVERTKHHTNLFAVLVGETAGGRKGTSWSMPRYILGQVDEEWAKNCLSSGLSTGEGLIYHIRDQRIEKQPIKENRKIVEYQDVCVDQGISDKRLLVIEEEFVTVLKNSSRPSNILSDIIRKAWDSHTLRPMIKNNPVQASDPHISIIGHITVEELQRHLSETERCNGFANRFIWLAVKRSKFIPNPTGVPPEILPPLISTLKEAVEYSKNVEMITRDQQAETIWAKVYEPLTQGKPGIVGALIARAAPQVMRVACLYALLDMSSTISTAHLKAALAFWDYAETSTKAIFGTKIGDRIADKILDALNNDEAQEGLSEEMIYNLFHGHLRAKELDWAQRTLEGMGKVRCERVSTSGKSKTIWRLM